MSWYYHCKAWLVTILLHERGIETLCPLFVLAGREDASCLSQVVLATIEGRMYCECGVIRVS